MRTAVGFALETWHWLKSKPQRKDIPLNIPQSPRNVVILMFVDQLAKGHLKAELTRKKTFEQEGRETSLTDEGSVYIWREADPYVFSLFSSPFLNIISINESHEWDLWLVPSLFSLE